MLVAAVPAASRPRPRPRACALDDTPMLGRLLYVPLYLFPLLLALSFALHFALKKASAGQAEDFGFLLGGETPGIFGTGFRGGGELRGEVSLVGGSGRRRVC